MYDPVSSRLVCTIDSYTGDGANSTDTLIPYIPYPINPDTGKPTVTRLTPVERRKDMRLGGPMVDGRTGLYVPILGMTIHPETGTVLLFLSLIKFSDFVGSRLIYRHHKHT